MQCAPLRISDFEEMHARSIYYKRYTPLQQHERALAPQETTSADRRAHRIQPKRVVVRAMKYYDGRIRNDNGS